MKSKKLSYIFALAASAMMLAACGEPGPTTTSEEPEKTSETSKEPSVETSETPVETSETPVETSSTLEDVEITMSACYEGGHATHMKFYSDNTKSVGVPYTDPEGNVYEDGDFKPAWAELQSKLNFTINDITPNDKLAANYTTHKTANWRADGKLINIAQGNATDIIKDGTGANGQFVDIAQYLDQMPNLKAFLEANPVVKKTIANSEGQIFYTPYFDGFEDVERMLMMRHDWVEKLLDGATAPAGLDTDLALKGLHYTGNMPATLDTKIKVAKENSASSELIEINKKYSTSIVAKFNAIGTLNGKTAVEALRSWIDETYGGAYGEKRSDLFLSHKAAYDIDELVMLFRCVTLNSRFLLGDLYEANGSQMIVPFFPRQARNDRVADFWRFMAFFGVRGTESRNGFYYVGEDGKLKDVRGAAEVVPALKHMHEMYQEGLILQDFDDKSKGTGKDGEFRNQMVKEQRGFATYDYNQTSTILQDSMKDFTGTFASVLPAVTEKDGSYIHYTESWRSVKPNSWFITKETENDQKVLARCLKLFDYLYSPEGNQILSYGPSAYIAKKADGVTLDTIEYMGRQVPKLSDATLAQIKSLTSGNYTNYYRYYVGATFPVGYVKEQGMEYQTVSAKAKPALNLYENAIANGTVTHVNHKMDNTNHLLDIVPATLPFTDAENTALAGTEYTKLGELFNLANGKSIVWTDIVKNGFGTYKDYDFSEENYLKTVNETLKLGSYLTYANDAYTRFKA